MTDEELVKRLRKGDTPMANHYMDEAADRIEALLNLNEALVELMDDRDAKLAKAVEIGNKMAHSIEGNYYLPNIAGEWRKVAAEIKGESHE